MAMLGRKPFNPNAYVPPVNIASSPVQPMARAPAPSMMMSPELSSTLGGLPQPSQLSSAPKHNWVGILADALSGLAGNGPVYAPLAARRQDEQTAFERGEETWQKHHAQDIKDQMDLLTWKAAHPDDEFTRQLDAAGITDPAQRAEYARKRLERSSDPLVTTTLPGDRIYSGPQSGLAAALSGAASSPMGGGVPTVSDKAGYDALPPGAQFRSPDGHIRVKGGQSPQGSGGFR